MHAQEDLSTHAVQTATMDLPWRMAALTRGADEDAGHVVEGIEEHVVQGTVVHCEDDLVAHVLRALKCMASRALPQAPSGRTP